MFKQTYLASAVFLALSSHAVYAADADAAEEQAKAKDAAVEQQKAADDQDDMEVIQVVGIRSSLNKSVNLKRQNVQVVDAIVAEDVGKFPDNNVVEALQRVTGVQVTDRSSGEVNTVSIRGLTDVTTTVNGRQIFTSTGRSVAIADIPAALLGSVEVFKTRSASQVGSGIAGQIDIRTHRPFDFDGFKGSVVAKGIYSDQPDKTDPSFSGMLSNRWDTSIGEVGALLNVSFIRTHYKDESVSPGASLPYSAEDGTAISSGWNMGAAHGIDNSEGATIDGTEYLLSRDAIFQNVYTGVRERPAVNLSLQWAPNDTSEYLFEAFYNGYRNEGFSSMLFSNVNSSDNWDQVVEDGIETYSGTNVVKSRTAYNVSNFTSGDWSKSSTDSYVFALGGKWDLNDWTLKSEVVYQDSTYKTQFLAMRGITTAYGVDVDFNTGNGLPSWTYLDDPTTDADESDLTDTSMWQTAQFYDNAGEDEGDSISWTLDVDGYLDWGIFTKAKAGLRVEKRGATSKSSAAYAYNNIDFDDLPDGMLTTTTGFFEGRANVPTTWSVINGYYVADHQSEIEELMGIDADDTILEKTFEVDELSWAAYAQSDFETELLGKRVDGQIGLRYEKADTDMTFWDEEDDVRVSSDGKNGSAKFLPSAVVRFWLTDDLVTRFVYTETIRRPAFSDLNSYISYTLDLTDLGYGGASGGNPGLQPVTSKNYDISLEYYFGSGSSVYGTWFRRDIEGLVYSSSSKIYYDYDEDGVDEAYILSLPDNTSNGKLEGYEVGAIYFPENLPAYLDGLGTQLSGTFLDSSQDIPDYDASTGELTGYTTRDMFGVSDSSYSAILIYDKETYSARLSYTWRSKFLNSYDSAYFAMPRGIYRKPESSLDFQLSYNVTDDLTLTFDATNILDDVYQEYYEDSTLYNRTNNIYTRTFALGLRYNF